MLCIPWGVASAAIISRATGKASGPEGRVSDLNQGSSCPSRQPWPRVCVCLYWEGPCDCGAPLAFSGHLSSCRPISNSTELFQTTQHGTFEELWINQSLFPVKF